MLEYREGQAVGFGAYTFQFRLLSVEGGREEPAETAGQPAWVLLAAGRRLQSWKEREIWHEMKRKRIHVGNPQPHFPMLRVVPSVACTIRQSEWKVMRPYNGKDASG